MLRRKRTGGACFATALLLAGHTLSGCHTVHGGAGAGELPTVDAIVHGGTRLRPRFLVTTEGETEFVGWSDTQRNERCTFRLATDGQYRCLPDAVGTYPQYVDAACTLPIAESPHGACGESVHYGASDNGVWPVTGALAPGATVYENGSAGCTATQLAAPNPNYPTDFFATGPAVPYASFAAAHEERGAAVSGAARGEGGPAMFGSSSAHGELDTLVQRLLVSDDGANELLGWTDQNLGAECRFNPAEGSAIQLGRLGRLGRLRGPTSDFARYVA